MYFKARGNDVASYVSKRNLVTYPIQYGLKGRKRYLHALRNGNDVQGLDNNGIKTFLPGANEPWRSRYPGDSKEQKVRIAPLPAGSEFIFEVDFSNLSLVELRELCASLTPHSSFEHKLGMGKPIGLGSTRVILEGLFLIDRKARYLQTSFAKVPRYFSVWLNNGANPLNTTSDIPLHLALDAHVKPTPGALSPKDLAADCMTHLQVVAPAVFNAIVLSGNPLAVRHPVHYPQVPGWDLETETFKWFVENDRGRNQQLLAFDDSTTALPKLKR